jgi:transposase
MGDPRSGGFFVFGNRRPDRLKVLYFDWTGNCIPHKRLARRTFSWIIGVDADRVRVEIDVEVLQRLRWWRRSRSTRSTH